MVVYINHTCILVIDLEDKSEPLPIKAILQRDYSYYKKDLDFDCHTVKIYWDYWKDFHNIFTPTQQIRL